MTWRDEPWFLGATILTAGHGGIARVARLTARALIDGGVTLQMLALADEEAVEIGGVASATTCGNRLAYAARAQRAAFRNGRFLYDAIGPARAHPPLWPRRGYGVWLHGIEIWQGLSRDRRRALNNAAFCIVNSQFTRARFEQLHGPLRNAHVCHLATEADDPAPARIPLERPPTVLLVGRPDAESFRKGHRETIDAWPRVCAALPGARLLLAGGGSGLGHLRTLASRSPVATNIEVLGFVPEERMPGMWARADVFALPSRQEGFGLVYIEAMRQGLPVIASVHDAGQEVNVDGQTGYNVDLTDPQMLADRIVALLSDPDKARAMGRAGQARWAAQFRYSAFRDRLWSILDRPELRS